MSDKPKEKRSPLLLWTAFIPGLVLVLMEILEPLIFEGERYDSWRIVKIVFWGSVAIMTLIQLRKGCR
jgi:hypothetical protein